MIKFHHYRPSPYSLPESVRKLMSYDVLETLDMISYSGVSKALLFPVSVIFSIWIFFRNLFHGSHRLPSGLPLGEYHGSDAVMIDSLSRLLIREIERDEFFFCKNSVFQIEEGKTLEESCGPWYQSLSIPEVYKLLRAYHWFKVERKLMEKSLDDLSGESVSNMESGRSGVPEIFKRIYEIESFIKKRDTECMICIVENRNLL